MSTSFIQGKELLFSRLNEAAERVIHGQVSTENPTKETLAELVRTEASTLARNPDIQLALEKMIGGMVEDFANRLLGISQGISNVQFPPQPTAIDIGKGLANMMARASEIVSGTRGGQIASLFQTPEAQHFSFTAPVFDLGLSARALNCLESHGIQYVRDLLTVTPEAVRRIPNLGPVTLREIEQKLAEKGLRIGMLIGADA